jgi:hypothetical protein
LRESAFRWCDNHPGTGRRFGGTTANPVMNSGVFVAAVNEGRTKRIIPKSGNRFSGKIICK